MDPLFGKARRFTDTEDATLLAWIQALNAGANAEATAVLDAGLYLEHITSLLSADLAQWTPEQAAEIARATRAFEVTQDAVALVLARQERDRAAGSPLQGSGGGDPAPGRPYGG